MFKLVALLALFVAVNAGLIGHGAISHGGYIAHAAPAAIAFAAPISHHASSYANHNSVSLHPVPIPVAHEAPLLHAAPIAHLGISHGHDHHAFYH